MKGVTKTILMLLCVSTAIALDEHRPSARKNQTCGTNFVRLSHRCYFFSKEKATWQDAFFQCHSMKSNLAIVKNKNQDKLIKRALKKKTQEPLERWLGGRFDWQQKQWKWAAPGKALSYQGFDRSLDQDESRLQWNCIIVDPNFDYRWNSRSCFEERHFICQRKVNNMKSKKTPNTSKLNEIPVPAKTNQKWDNLKSQQRIQNPFRIEVSPLLNTFEIGDLNRAVLKKTKSKTKKKNARASNHFQLTNQNILPSDEINDQPYRSRRNKGAKETDGNQGNFQIYYRTYKEGSIRNDPLHPRPIVEEYNIATVS